MNLLSVEMRRALGRRAIRVLIATAVLGCVAAGLIAFFSSSGKNFTEEGSPAIVTEWWTGSEDGGVIAIASFFLFLGAFVAGATLAGGEWRAGTMTTMLTWEPRRGRVHAARTGAAALLAWIISFLLQALFLASFLPAVFVYGTTAGADASFWTDLLIFIARTSVITAGCAVLGVALATAARNTAFAVITVFAWFAVVESILRGIKPSSAPWLWGENLVTVAVWDRMTDSEFTRSPIASLATLTLYLAVIVAASTISFTRRDIGMAT
jgi:ABC-type transport system involved in multi-copper enzyme maturation permease subunit